MKVIMTGGGTGGHIYPAIAIADKIEEKQPDAEILFVGTKKGLEKTLVPGNGYPIEFITVSGFDRRNMLKNIKTAADLVRGLSQAKKIIKSFKPDVVIGTGGYVCGPVVKTAAKMGVRTYIHEQKKKLFHQNKTAGKRGAWHSRGRIYDTFLWRQQRRGPYQQGDAFRTQRSKRYG